MIIVRVCHNEGDIQLAFYREYTGSRLMRWDQVDVLGRKLPVDDCLLVGDRWEFTLSTYYTFNVNETVDQLKKAGYREYRTDSYKQHENIR